MSSSDGADAIDGWRALLGPRYVRTSTLLAGGVALYATNEFVTASLLPSAIADIGGERLYAWVTTLYLVGSVVTASMVNAALSRIGPRPSYLLGLAVFGIGSVVCAVAPDMELLLVGRTLQGAAGGLLAGLGYALINAVSAAIAVDQSLGAGGGDVGRRDGGGAGGRRILRAVRLVALGLRCRGDPDRGDGRPGSGGAARRPRQSWRLLVAADHAGLVGAAARRRGADDQRRRRFRRTPP